MSQNRLSGDGDGLRSYEVGHAALREIVIRSGAMLPAAGDAREARWAAEGWTGGTARRRPDGTPDTRTLETARG